MPKIGLDAGHYPGDGRVGKSASKLGTKDEYTLNLRTYKAVEYALRCAGYEVVDIGRQDTSVVGRAKRCGSYGCNALVSLHHNAGGGRGISLFRHINGVMGTQSLNLQNCLYKYLKGVNAGNRSKPVGAAELGVLNCSNTKCPATLIECAFMDNDVDIALINSSDYNTKIATAIVNGLNEFFGRASSAAPAPSAPAASTPKADKKYNPYAYGVVCNLTAGDVLNVRTEPNAKASKLAAWPALGQGNEVDVIESYANGWAKVNIQGNIGYVSADYLKITERATTKTAKVVGCTNLNLRSTPNGTTVRTVYAGAVLEVIGEGKDSDGDTWTKVNYGGTVAYVWPKYIQIQ